MSNVNSQESQARKRFSRSASAMPKALKPGATKTPCDSASPTCLPKSSVKVKSSCSSAPTSEAGTSPGPGAGLVASPFANPFADPFANPFANTFANPDKRSKPGSAIAARGHTLADRVSRPDYALNFSALAERIADAPEPCSALELLHQCVAVLGAEQGFLISFVRDSIDTAACRLMVACDPVWCQHYLEKDCLQHDPWLLYATRHSEPVVASCLPVGPPSGQAVVNLARAHGFASAAIFPAHSGAGLSRISVLVLGSSQPGYFEADGFARLRVGARTLAAEFHDWWLKRIRREFLLRSKFTADDLDLLRRQQLGHTSKKMAIDLGMTHQSINSRYQRMNQRVGVLNRRSALTLAQECGLLD